MLFWAGFVLGAIVAGIWIAGFLCLQKHKKTRSGASDRTEIELLSRLTGGLAHEIKNPLSIIKVSLKLISESLARGDEKTAPAARKIEIVRKETDRVEQILEDFLCYIKKTEPHLAAVNINRTVSESIDFYSPKAFSQSVNIRSSLSEQSLICTVDEDMLKQVLLNLLINAQQAMPNGGDIMIRTQKNVKNAVIIISDTGRGIEAKKLGRIFDAYYSNKPGGNGLGLPTSKKIIDAHKGSIKVDSAVGKGTSFTIQLPLGNV